MLGSEGWKYDHAIVIAVVFANYVCAIRQNHDETICRLATTVFVLLKWSLKKKYNITRARARDRSGAALHGAGRR